MKKLLLALVLALVLVPSLAVGQAVQLDPMAFSVGGGSMLGEEGLVFSWDAAFAAVHWDGIELFGEATTGIGVEVHPATMLDGPESLETTDYRVWSLSRVSASVLQLPGGVWDSMYLGGDVLVASAGPLEGGFDARFVYGVKEGPIQLEIYMLEKYRPISFAFFYKF